MTVRTDVKAGIKLTGTNHNETLVVRTNVKAGGALWIPPSPNHNETLR